MTQAYTAPSAVPFDLDEDSVADAVGIDANAGGVADVVGFDLDEDSVADAVAIDANADGVADVVGFDLDEDSVADAVALDTDADGVLDATTGFTLDDDSSAEASAVGYEPAPDESSLEDDMMFTPPEDISNADVEQASQDVAHSQLMNQYMLDNGVIS